LELKKDEKVKKNSFISEVFLVIKKEKKWWLIPLIFILFVIVGLMIFVAGAGPLAPFLYPLL